LVCIRTEDLGGGGYELFFDNLYLDNIAANDVLKNQFGGAGFIITPNPNGYQFTIGLSSLFKINPASAVKFVAYPTLDLTFPITDERRLQVEAYLSASTALKLLPFDFTSIYNAGGVGLSQKFPNFLAAAGIDIGTLNWNFRFVGSLQNNTEGNLATDMLNSTLLSGKRLLANIGPYFSLGAEVAHTSENLAVRAAYQLPIRLNLSGVVPLLSDAATSGDSASIELAYTKDALELKLGMRRVGFLTSFSNLFDFSGGFSGFVANVTDFLVDGVNAQPYLSGRYTAGMFSVYGNLLVDLNGPRIDLGAEIAVNNKSTVASQMPTSDIGIPADSSKKQDGLTISADIRSAYSRIFQVSPNGNYLFIKPVLTIAKDSFSLGLGPQLQLDLNDSLAPSGWYSHDDTSWYSFGSGYASTLGKIYDIATDTFNLIDHVRLGTKEDSAYLDISRNQIVSLGKLVNNLSTHTESPFENRLGLQAKTDGKIVDFDVIVNDLTDPQLGGFRVGITPFSTWKGELGISLVGNAFLSDALKRVDLFPSIDLDLPFVNGTELTAKAQVSFTTMLGYEYPTSFDQMLVTGTSPSFFNNLDNYLITAGVGLESGAFTLLATAATQKGALSLGMFDEFHLRNRSFLLDAIDTEWTNPTAGAGRTWVGAMELGWKSENLELSTSYQLPIAADFSSLLFNADKFSFNGSLKSSFADFTLGFTRKAFLPAAQDLLTGAGSIISRIKEFLFDGQSQLFASASTTQGPFDFFAKLSATARYQADSSWNGSTALPITAATLADVVVSPALTLGVGIALY